MKNNNRLYNLLAAGTLTLLLALTFFLFRGNGFGTAVGSTNSWTGTTPAVVTSRSAVDSAITTDQAANTTEAAPAQGMAVTTLQEQNAKLTQMLQVMQEREKQYQSQLAVANQALQTNQAQVAASYEGDEHHDHEWGEHEEGEHEAHGWFGEQDDDD